MLRLIVTANCTAEAFKGMLQKPSDRAAATRSFVEAAGGKLVDYYITTGPKDFLMVVDVEDATDLLAGLMAAGAAGAIANTETIRALSSEEFTATQKKAAGIASKYSAPGS